jgi:integration host factor subunit beta
MAPGPSSGSIFAARYNFHNTRLQEIIMTKAELIEDVSRVVEMSRKDSEIIVETIFDAIVKSLKAGDKIEIRGFGSFRTRQRKPRIGRNPKTGTRVDVPAKKIPYFKPSKELKDLVNTSHAAEAAAATPPSPPETSAH